MEKTFSFRLKTRTFQKGEFCAYHTGGMAYHGDARWATCIAKNLLGGVLFLVLHPGRLTWNLQITHLERKMIFQTSMIMFHVNLPGCKRGFLDTTSQTFQVVAFRSNLPKKTMGFWHRQLLGGQWRCLVNRGRWLTIFPIGNGPTTKWKLSTS